MGGFSWILFGYLIPAIIFFVGYISVQRILRSQYFEVNSLHTNSFLIKIWFWLAGRFFSLILVANTWSIFACKAKQNSELQEVKQNQEQ
jgi:hypothetical protein